MAGPLRVGIIGVNASGGWAGVSHAPAVLGLPGLVLQAVAAGSRETADEAAHAFDASWAYASGLALVADPDIDVVTVATRVPDHAALALAALAHGKRVYCEWPLGRDDAECVRMACAAKAAGVHHVVGLQSWFSRAVTAAREQLASGSIGRLLSLGAFSSTAGFGVDVPASSAYLEEPANFANLVTIQGAHTLDLLAALGGAVVDLSALASRQFPQVRIAADAAARPRRTFDHLLAHGHLASGAPFSMEVAGGRADETPFRLELVGERGILQLIGGASRGAQSGRIGLVGNGEPLTIDEGELAVLPDAAVNVGAVYVALRDDIAAGTTSSVGFDHAARLTRTIEATLRSSAARRVVSIDELSA